MRRDKRGRRIGFNWWREYNVGLLRAHNNSVAWHDGFNHQMEPEEFRAANPLLTLKLCLVTNKGMRPDQAA